MSAKLRLLRTILRLTPADWRRRLGMHLGVPDVRWSLQQLKRFGFDPQHVVDAGAFEGEWARDCLSVFPKASIMCVEPQDAPQGRLKALATEMPSVRITQALLGTNTLDSVPFRQEGVGSNVISSIGCLEGMRMTTIDDLIASGSCEPPELLKMDVQGHELEVMSGWRHGFDRCEVIQLEMSLLPLVKSGPELTEVIDYLHRRGFVMFDITEIIRSPSECATWQIDAVFCREDSKLRTGRSWNGCTNS